MSLLESPDLSTTSSPLQSTKLAGKEYVLSLASLPNCYAASASSPAISSIYTFDKSSLQKFTILQGQSAITSLKAVNIHGSPARPLLAWSGKDGVIKVWDDRAADACVTLTSPGNPRSLLCFDVSTDGSTIAAGTDLQGDDALIQYWDPRNPSAPMRTHGSTHSDDITALHFLPSPASAASSPKILLSASSDGLISTSNADEEDEDEAVLHVGNWGCSVSQAGWISVSAGAQAWAGSDMETFSCWSDELDMLQDQDIRKPSIHHQGMTWVTDYLIGCHNSTQPGSPGLGVFVGSNEGDVGLVTSSNLSSSTAPWSLHRLWTHGHVGVIRSLLWDEPNNVLVTGGEDSKINIWPVSPLDSEGPSATGVEDDSMDVDMEDPAPSRKRGWDSGKAKNDWDDQNGKRARRS